MNEGARPKSASLEALEPLLIVQCDSSFKGRPLANEKNRSVRHARLPKLLFYTVPNVTLMLLDVLLMIVLNFFFGRFSS